MSRFGDRLNRREYLSGASALGIGALAGCNGIGDGGDEGTTTPTTTTRSDGEESVQGVVVDPTGSTVEGARVEMVHDPSADEDPPNEFHETATDSDGAWNSFADDDLAGLREEYPDTIYLLAESDDWFATRAMPAERFFDPSATHRIELDRQLLYGPQNAGGDEEIGADDYYGTVTVWREFVGDDQPWRQQRFRMLIRGTGDIESGIPTVTNTEKGMISWHFPEGFSTDRSDVFRYVDRTDESFYNFVQPDSNLEPYRAHPEIGEEIYQRPTDDDSDEWSRIGEIAAETLIGWVPYVGDVIVTANAVVEIFDILHDPNANVVERVGTGSSDSISQDAHDSVIAAHDGEFASMLGNVTLTFDEDAPDEIDLWAQADWLQPWRGPATGRGKPVVKLDHGLTVSPVPAFPGSGGGPEPAEFSVSLSVPDRMTVGEPADIAVVVTNEGESRGTYRDTVHLAADDGSFSEPVEVTVDPGETGTVTVSFTPRRDGQFRFLLASGRDSAAVRTEPRRVSIGDSLSLADGVDVTLTDVEFPANVAYEAGYQQVLQPSADRHLVLFRFSAENTGSEYVDLSTETLSLVDGTLFRRLPGDVGLDRAEIRGRPLSAQSLSPGESTTGWVLGAAPTATLRETISLSVRDEPAATDPIGVYEVPPPDGGRSFPQFELVSVDAPATAGLDEPYEIALTVENVGDASGRVRGVLEYSTDDRDYWQPLVTATEHRLSETVPPGETRTLSTTNAAQTTGEFVYRFQPYDRTWETEITS